jgi:tetratricopeptide (TPR) repeat protein
MSARFHRPGTDPRQPSDAHCQHTAVDVPPEVEPADAHFIRGTALASDGKTLEAAQQFQAANRLRPDHPATLVRLGLLLSQLTQQDAALACARRALELQPDDPAITLGLATILYRGGDIVASVPVHRRAVALAPANAIAWTALGDCLLAMGDHEEAIACLRQALALDPDQLAARRSLATCGLLAADPQDIDRLSEMLDRSVLPTNDRITAGFALGQMLDDAGRFDEAFARFAVANALVVEIEAAAGNCFDAAGFEAEIDRLIAQVTPAPLMQTRGWGNPSDLPVFVIGMPRSGSTLVEQIIASHSQAFGLGESTALEHVIGAITQLAPFEPFNVDASAALRVANQHLAHLQSKAAGAGREISRIADKLLDNVFHLHLIAALFPNARIVVCRRDLRDVCLSCYFHRFAEPMLYAYDLAACARRAVAIDRLITHWRAVLPLRMHEVVYETLVARPIDETWRLIDFLGLPREASCLEPHRTRRVVTTSSAWQVRQPINSRSVGRWRHYRRHLGNLLEMLGDDC